MSRYEADKLRYDNEDFQADISRRRQPSEGGSPTRLVVAGTRVTYPTSAGTYFYCTPQNLAGAEVEGGAGTVTAAAGNIFALNLGTAVPPAGTLLLVTFVGNRWVFRYDG